MISILSTNNKSINNVILDLKNDHKTAFRKYNRPEEIFYSQSYNLTVSNNDESYNDNSSISSFISGDESVHVATVNVRNKTNSSILVGYAERLVIDKRLNTANYRQLDGVEKVPSTKSNHALSEIGFDPVVSKVNDKTVHSVNTKYERDEGITKGIILECQSANYIELMPVVENRIIGVVGLPPGMIFEYGKIKGSPSKSGDYRGLITLSDGRTINLMIKVSRIRRMF